MVGRGLVLCFRWRAQLRRTFAMDASVHIIDDDVSARRGLTRLVKALGYQALTHESAASFLASPCRNGPGCILLDVRMPGMTGPELQETLLGEEHALPIIFLSAHGDVPTVANTMKRGAIHFLTKPVDRDDLARVIEEAMVVARKREERHLEQEEARQKIDLLTPREHEVLTHVITGRLNKQIAADLGVTEDTVKIHRSRMMQKLGIYSAPELLRLCDLLNISAAEGGQAG
jgi:FixJ family two-component response regulator